MVTYLDLGGGRVLLRVNGRPVEARIMHAGEGRYTFEWRGRQFPCEIEDDLRARAGRARRRPAAQSTGPVQIRAPMPGTVLQVLVAEGERILAGQSLLILEAMKMQNEVSSPSAGTVRRLTALPGQAVEAHQPLCEIASTDGQA